MIIRKVELENFISHKHTVVELEPGITVIVGPNGSGKTSIIDAITFALFKEHTRGGKLVNLVNRGSSRARVKLSFNVNGIDYTIERIIVRETPQTARQQEVYLYKHTDKGPILIARGDKKVNEELGRILGVSPKTYTLSVFVKQGEIENLITATPAERKKAIGELLGLNKLEKAYDKIRDVINYWAMKAATVEAEALKLREREQRLKQLNEYYSKLVKELEEKEKQLNSIEEELKVVERKVKKIEEKRDKKIKLELKLRPLEREIEFLEKEKNRLEKEIKDAQEALILMKRTLLELRKLELVEQGVEALRRLEDLGEPEKQLEDLLKKINELKNERDNIKEKADNYLEIKEKIRVLREELDRIEYKLRESEALRASINELLQQENRIKQKIRMMIGEHDPQEHLSLLEKEIKHLEEEVKTYEDILRGIETEIRTAQSKVSELSEKIKNLKTIKGDRCPTCGQFLPLNLREKIINRLEYDKKRIDIRIKELEEEKKDILRGLNEAKHILEERRSIAHQLRLLVENLESIRSRRKTLEDKLRVIEQYIKNYEDYREKLNELTKKEEELEKEYHRLLTIEVQLKEMLKKQRELEEKIQRAHKLIDIIHRVEKETGIPRQKFYEAKERLDKLRIEVRALEEKAKQLNKLRKDYEKVVHKLDESRRQYNEIKGILKELSFSEEEYRKLRELVEDLRAKHRRILEDVSGIRRVVERVQEELGLARKEYEKSKKAKEEKEKLDKLISVLRRIRELYSKDGLQKIIRAYAKELIEYYVKDIVARFNLNFSDISLDEDFNITVTTPLGEQPVDTISGGERVALAIALRLALARALVGKGVESIILDEPTIHLDEERRRELVRILRSSFAGAREIVSQLIIVTHDRELEDAADIIYQVTRVNGYSRVTKIA